MNHYTFVLSMMSIPVSGNYILLISLILILTMIIYVSSGIDMCYLVMS